MCHVLRESTLSVNTMDGERTLSDDAHHGAPLWRCSDSGALYKCRRDYTIGTLDVLQACDACTTYSVLLQCTDCVVFPKCHNLLISCKVWKELRYCK